MLALHELSALKEGKIPRHIAIIPDGNRRWAKGRALKTKEGHEKGADGLMEIVKTAKGMGVEAITFYSFSTENWNRSKEEIEGLMWLIETYLKSQLETMKQEGIQFHAIGHLDPLPDSLKSQLRISSEETKSSNTIKLTLAFNYGGRDEITRALRKIASQVASQKIDIHEIDETMISNALDTRFLSDPDLLIRTSGECRLSNFLLWQLSYAEMVISPVLWPDFTPRHLAEAVQVFQQRERRRGG